MSPTARVAIVGFTGKIARMITKSILKSHPDVEIHGICRSASKVDPSISSHPNVKIFEAESMDLAALQKGLAGTSVCICCYLGPHALMIDGQKTLIDACIAENVPRYIASDWSLDFRNLKLGDHPAKDPMKHIQTYLEEKEAEGEIKGVHILTGAFMEVMWAPFLGIVDANEGVFKYWGTGDEKYDTITYEDAAKFTAEIAVDPNANGFINVLGDRKSVKEMAQVYQKVYGIEPRVERLGSLEELFTKMTTVFNKSPQNIFAWMGMYYHYWILSGKTKLGELDNDRYTTIKPINMEEFLKRYTKDTVGMSAQF
ncbi:hypothetical protein BGZ60DRAFT_532068 [Tricladium varicosporioides]|nr:hypothetical protein BGZ60DRAFT_532068 [Hymenoscyphus varicosporioides]